MIDSEKLRKCFAVCKKVSFERRYLRNEDFCNDNFIEPLGGQKGKVQTIRATFRTILGGILENRIHVEYAEKIGKMVGSDEYAELGEIRPEDILALGTIYYYLGNKFKLMLYVNGADGP